MPLFGGATRRTSDLLQKPRDVFFGAGGPGERRAVVHQLPGHDERVSPLQLAVVALAVVMDPEAAWRTSTISIVTRASCLTSLSPNHQDSHHFHPLILFIINHTVIV